MSERLPSYGGQAVIEGVLMRGSRAVAMAMRAPGGEITLHTEILGGIYTSFLARIPFLRGLVILWDSLGLGMRFLTISANTQTGEEEKLEGPVLYLTLGISLLLGVGLFFLLPAVLGQLAERFLGFTAWWSNLLEGVIRLVILVAYIWAVGRMPDIARVFAYHGAEHKTINAFEAGADLTPENVAHYSVEHTRCGTAFLLTVAIFSVFLFSFLGPLPILWRLVSRILLIPVLAGIAYEYIRWTSRHQDSALIRALVRPNLALQHLTTREPTLEMLEVAITAFKSMLASEKDLIA
jgi:uncharacterized protein YqhQ